MMGFIDFLSDSKELFALVWLKISPFYYFISFTKIFIDIISKHLKMNEFLILILVSLFATNSLDKAESVKVKLEETQLKTFDEIFGEGWWDKGETEDLKTPPTNFGQNVHHQIDQQNTQIGQIEPNSTDQLGQIEPNSTDQIPPFTESDHSGQIEPNSTDQNPPLSESDHSDNAKNGEEQNKIMKEITANEKVKIVANFHAIKDEFKHKGKYLAKERTKIEVKIAKHLKVNREKIYKWKKEVGLRQKVFYEKEERKNLLEKFDQRKAELKRDGFKNSYSNQIDETVAKELGLCFITIYRWKRKLGQTKPNNKYSHSKQKELIKRYYEIKGQIPKIRDEDIAKILKIGSATLVRWKSQFKRQQLHHNVVEGHSVENNAESNVQEIGNSNSGSI